MFASFQAWSACSKKTFNVKPLWSDNPYRWQISHDYFSPFPCQAFLPIGPHSGCSDWPSSPARRGRGTAAFDIDTPTSHTPSNDLDQTVCLLGHQKVCFFSLSGRALPSHPHPPPRFRLLLYLPLFFYRQTCHDVWYEEFASEAVFNNQPVFVLSPGSLLGFTEVYIELDLLKSHALKFSVAKNLSFNFQSGR